MAGSGHQDATADRGILLWCLVVVFHYQTPLVLLAILVLWVAGAIWPTLLLWRTIIKPRLIQRESGTPM
jgi:hypothetical protein